MKTFLLLTFPILFLLPSCTKDPQQRLEDDIDKIKEYLEEHNLNATSTASGLHIIMEVEGTGGHPTISDEVTVHYKGYFLDEEVFDETGAQPATFPWPTSSRVGRRDSSFQKGGKGTLFIPSALGYGQYPPPGIPKNAVLIFDVELVDF
ncbi:MAG: FKBP-type peptidyl-prolyl cis-trans isomerase [Saprospirales bacterium]|nr:FKBP-type peptidyl-prolyl cis-trans isomerase [Saprospirales bacterium]